MHQSLKSCYSHSSATKGIGRTLGVGLDWEFTYGEQVVLLVWCAMVDELMGITGTIGVCAILLAVLCGCVFRQTHSWSGSYAR